jgi:hypothetical protein
MHYRVRVMEDSQLVAAWAVVPLPGCIHLLIRRSAGHAERAEALATVREMLAAAA